MGSINLSSKKEYPFFVENPVPNDDIPRHRMTRAFRVDSIVALKIGGSGTYDYELRHSPNANDQGAGTLIHSVAGVNNETTGDIDTPPGDFAAITIPAGDWVWLEIPAASTGLARVVAADVRMLGVELGG